MEILKFKEIILNPDLKDCFIEDNSVKLTKSEYTLLCFLISNKNKVFSRREIINNIKGRMGLRAVDTSISRLRKKLGKYGSYIVTKSGFGYGLIDKI